MKKTIIIKDICCKREDCFANVKGTCSVLKTTNFKRGCPFYKPKEEK